ncbi:MAG: cell wall hydrolase [Eubacterium sp.]|nr:cell wall hydrolase [Eubacterium sp.]
MKSSMMLKKVVITVMAALMLVGGLPQTVEIQAAAKEEKEVTYTKRDLKLLASIIYCEAGNQSKAGKVAVGCVVMNRKRSKSFPNTIEGVIRQRGQFSPVAQGKFSRELALYNKGAYSKGARKLCVNAAKAALKGQDYVTLRGKKVNMRKYHFFSQRLSRAKLRIGGHDFK